MPALMRGQDLIRIAQDNAAVEGHVFRDRVLTVLATVEQTYSELSVRQ